MNSLYVLSAVLLAISSVSQAYLPYAAYFPFAGDYPGFGYYGLGYPYHPYAAFAYGAYGGFPSYGYHGYPYGLHGFYHPRSTVRNVARSFHRVDGHLSDTSMLSPLAKDKKN